MDQVDQANAEFLDPDLLKDAEATNQRPALSPDADELKTTVLPPITPPPPAPAAGMAPLPSFPPPEMAPTFSMNDAPAPTRPSLGPAPAGARAPRPSWLRGLLTSTFPPPGAEGAVNAQAPIAPTVAGVVFVVLGLVFAVVSLVTGLRGVPSEPGLAPVVAAALVLARSLLALGAGALSFVFFRQAERLLVKTA